MSIATLTQENFSQDKDLKITKKNHSKKTSKRKDNGKGKKKDKKQKQKEKTHTSQNKKNKKSKNKILKSGSKEKTTNTSDSEIRNDLPLYRQRKFRPVSKAKKHNKEISQKIIPISPQKDKKKKTKKKNSKKGSKKDNKKNSKIKKDELKIKKSPATRSSSFPSQKSTPISKRNRQSSMLPNSNQSQRKIIDLLRRRISKKQTKLDRLEQQFHKIEKERNDVKVEYKQLNTQRHKLLCSKCIHEKIYLNGEKIDYIAQQQCKEFISRMEKGVQILDTIKNRNEKDKQLLNISQRQLSVIQKIEI
ncbi:hypothetical protein M0812_18096 [Anaeramoeba flamelloides]|uniref:Uncharacterized protein n=1 Tax=Anaeramoeba flamelloides TaxID=1746091 RepID=A0AAV7Z6V8_9EUKA|nr:hypothetical protein M0812_18096 [Anaeramoeba flamelloides]